MSNIYHSSYGNRALLENSDSDTLFFTALGTSKDDETKNTLFGALCRKEIDVNTCAIAFLSEEDKEFNNLDVDSGFYYLFKIEKSYAVKILHKVGRVGEDGPKGEDATAIMPPQGDKGEIGNVTLQHVGARDVEETPVNLNKTYHGIINDSRWINNVTIQSGSGAYREKITRYNQTTITDYIPPCYTFEHSFNENNYAAVTKGLILLNPYAGIFQNIKTASMTYLGGDGSGLTNCLLNDGTIQYFLSISGLRRDGSNRLALAYYHEEQYNGTTDILTRVYDVLRLVQILEDDSIVELTQLGSYEWSYYTNLNKGYGRITWSQRVQKASNNLYTPLFTTFRLTPVYAEGSTSTIIDYDITVSTPGIITLSESNSTGAGMAQALFSLMNNLEIEVKDPFE